jgi:glycosyltransferase involved in cell wall biosynthesis
MVRSMKNYKMLPVIKKTKKVSNPPLVSVIIPTRNESKRISPCITSLINQTYPNMEVIIVDDSTDNTREIIKTLIKDDPRFQIIKEKRIVGGWVGKPHALQQGSKKAKGKWILFIDADTSFDPDVITSTINHAKKNKLDMLSILSHLVCQSLWEKIIQPIPTGLLIFIMPLGKVNDPKCKQSFALGPFILIKHTVFKRIGGYQKIKTRIADDVELAKLVKTSGFRIGLARAYHLMNLRMYESLKDIWNGWSKNIFMGLVQKREIQKKPTQLLVLFFGLFVVFLMMVFPFLSLLLGILLTVFSSTPRLQTLIIVSAAIWVSSLIIQMLVHTKYSIGNPCYSPFYFIGGIVTMLIFLNSAVKTINGSGVKWKDRTYTNQPS